MPRPKFKKGAANPGHATQRPKTGAGRAKGVGNKVSRDIKEMLLDALVELGGSDWFKKLGKSQKHKSTLAGLLKGVIPIQVAGSGGSTDEQAAAVRARIAEIDDSTTGGKKP